MKHLLTAVGVLALLTVAGLAVVRLRMPNPQAADAESHAARGAAQQFLPLWPAPSFSLTGQDGRAVSLQSLHGKPWVVNFIFTQCRTVCPLLTAKMVQLQRRLRGADLAFVSISVDPEHDTREVLQDYARRWAPGEDRWHLLATTPALLTGLARDFRVAVDRSSPTELNPIIHSSVFLLVDGNGMVRGAFDSELAADFAALERGARMLSSAPPPAEEEALAPEELYHALACANCHERPELAPPLFGRAGTQRELENSLRVPFDAAYVRESLISPDAKRARGYPLKMPTYEGLVTAAQADALAAWILARPATPAAADGAEVAVDPVCQMKVRVTKDALSAEVAGRVHYFCAESCRKRFLSGAGSE